MSKTKNQQEKIKELIKLLDCTEEEALDIIRTDEIIDKGGRTEYDLPIEQEKMAIRMSAVNERKVKDKKPNNRGKIRAENPTKSGIIAEIAEFLEKISKFDCKNVKILNKERQIGFKIADNDYEFTLVQKRKKKN